MQTFRFGAYMQAKLAANGYGLMLCVVIGALAILASTYIALDAAILAIIFGIAIGNMTTLNTMFKCGIKFSEQQVLSLSIALMGVNLNFLILEGLGMKTFLLVLAALIFTIFTSIILAKIFHLDKKTGLLLGIGNAVCGSSAIAATERIIGANEEEVGISIAVVNFMGTIGILLVPMLATVVLKFSDMNSGIFVGNLLQSVGQVVAAGFSINDSSGHIAIIIKMTRILLLIPLVLVLLFIFSNKANPSNTEAAKPKVPLFIIGFIMFSLLPSFHLLTPDHIKVISETSYYLLIVAMSAIGLKIRFQSILRNGRSALTIGGLTFVIQILFSSSMMILLY